MTNIEDFKKELTKLINKYNIEAESNTPDFILAGYLADCLTTYSNAISQRDKWYNPTPTLAATPSTNRVGFGVTEPTPITQPAGAKPAGGYLAEKYRQLGGIPVKQRYIDEVKQREN